MDRKTHYLFFLAIVFLVGAAGSWATSTSLSSWYLDLPISRYSPPPHWFSIIWPVLYGLIAAAGARLWRRRQLSVGRKAFGWWVVQLVLNGLWPWLFFYLQQIEIAAIELTLLIFAVGILLFYTRKVDKVSFLMLIPYGIWLVFAGFLNWSVFLATF